MTATISGDGTSTLINLTTSGNTVLGDASTDTLNVGNGGLVKDASGNVGIGTASPAFSLDVRGDGQKARFGNTTIGCTVGNYVGGTIWGFANNAGSGGMFGDASNYIYFASAGAERMRIDSSGNLLVGVTSSFGVPGKVCIQANTCISLKGVTGTNAGDIEFVRNDTNARAYVVTANGNDYYIANANFTKFAQLLSQSFTGWTFGSDARIKKNIEDLKYGLNAVLAMKPREFDYISDDAHDIGFIAQELRQVVPEVVSGEEVPFSDDDTPQERAKKTMGITKEALIPVLVKAIQEQQALIASQSEIITQLQADVAALKGR